jgi:hypothetical protein
MADNELTTKQHKAIAALLSEPTIKQAAEAARIGERTLHTWLGEPAFDSAYRKARRAAVAQATAQLQRASAEAVAVLTQIMNNATNKAADRISAASKVLDMAIKAVELDDLDARISALEEMQHAAETV